MYLLNRNKISGVNEEVKSSKSMLREQSLTIGGGGKVGIISKVRAQKF